ncbi:hypothetical protein ACRE_073740 [Hapsidospora chrysogenum ATCC 11550]|uniref:Uncharacterized protein n=1 Tax=Hapsidospora chrysogenum (strain ATCC 11550 / CBS 779.69 / DSM 880 / IAM 14645 / JCM 23072 / IMI 49137) TaxID=857340 RepID=A0A086SXS4_HAPC1|nr:hypothetical protein ACRE_073740 [Hapsidospora chrysogenum ATCC 11550]
MSSNNHRATTTPPHPPLRPKLASIVTGPLVQPSRDPETGLELFPRLPSMPGEEEEEEAVFTDSEPSTPSGDKRGRTASHSSFTESVRQLLFGKTRTTSSSSSASARSRADDGSAQSTRDSATPPPQPERRRNESSGQHMYCRHTWDEGCKCLTILVIDQGGEYCAPCWAGECGGNKPWATEAASSGTA